MAEIAKDKIGVTFSSIRNVIRVAATGGAYENVVGLDVAVDDPWYMGLFRRRVTGAISEGVHVESLVQVLQRRSNLQIDVKDKHFWYLDVVIEVALHHVAQVSKFTVLEPIFRERCDEREVIIPMFEDDDVGMEMAASL